MYSRRKVTTSQRQTERILKGNEKNKRMSEKEIDKEGGRGPSHLDLPAQKINCLQSHSCVRNNGEYKSMLSRDVVTTRTIS